MVTPLRTAFTYKHHVPFKCLGLLLSLLCSVVQAPGDGVVAHEGVHRHAEHRGHVHGLGQAGLAWRVSLFCPYFDTSDISKVSEPV